MAATRLVVAGDRLSLAAVWSIGAALLVALAVQASAESRPAGPATTVSVFRQVASEVSAAGVQLGFHAVDLGTGRTIWQHRADELLIPASNVKLAVTAGALARLGKDFEFRTQLIRWGAHLAVVGGGDPAIGDPRICDERDEPITGVFQRWAAAVRSRGLASLKGDLLIDASIFEPQRVHPRWAGRQYAAWYRAPVGGLNFNDNCIDVEVWPASKVGVPAAFRLVPPAPHVQVTNKCMTGKRNKPVVWRAPDEDRLVLSGRCSRRCRLAPAAVVAPGLLFGWACHTVLKDNGVEVAGTVRRQRLRRPDGSLPEGAELIAEWHTSLPVVLRRCNKRSQNLFAECLLKMIGLHVRGEGSWQAGVDAVTDFLHEIGARSEGLRLDDGSGLSLGNRMSARSLTEILTWVWHHPDGQLLIASLPVAGVDGSLGKRLRDPDLQGRIRAKTGSLNGVRALSGYADAPGGTIAFSMLFNETGRHGKQVVAAERRLCRALLGLDSVKSTRPSDPPQPAR